ncbi:MAG: tRNA pseudouridine(55) synthase TruB [Bacteroidetes bacterium]|nr:tRNA pseudouridine(55) synthase TruB [Bacteroidota bacterium]
MDPAIQQQYLEGKILLVDKPLHWTSFDVIRKLRGMLQIKKIGHAGTLDPLATGLLLVCTGKFTKKINGLMAAEKEYTGTITLGAVTPTYDLESLPAQHKDYSFVSEALLKEAALKFTGTILQKPPVYSAIKKDGVALYELARRGEEVDLQPRPVTIFAFDITGIELPQVHFKVTCSTGTYIRSLAHDFGAALGCGGYLSALRRTKVGEHVIEQSQTIEQVEAALLPASNTAGGNQNENG